jgi:hypothetical protein
MTNPTSPAAAATPDATPADPRYPIGKFAPPPQPLSAEHRDRVVQSIAALPGALRTALEGMDESRLDTPYREGGWTVRQLVHHLADSHMNAYVRVRLALTEDGPAIKAYDEQAWARLPDSLAHPVTPSLAILDGVHERWAALMRSTPGERWTRGLEHSERGTLTIDFLMALYAWHGEHHVAHVTTLRRARGW